MNIREEIEDIERKTLSKKACLSSYSRGRDKNEKPHHLRTCFQRDRDRIIHCKSFRRLKHKTQVFLAPFGDHFRTRLTHTLEVSQIARTIAKALKLNEDLTEAIGLGHDLGHTPFGHSGEKVLNEVIPGGFKHYEQSLRIIEKLEYKGKGLNLTFEVKDGIFKHSKGRGEILNDKKQNMPCTLEGQVVRVSDIIAYVNHDIDDAIRAGVIKKADLPAHLVDIFGKWHASRIDKMVEDVVRTSLKFRLDKIKMSDDIRNALSELRDFLYDKVYFKPDSRKELAKADKIIKDLYQYFLKNPENHIKEYPKEDSLERRTGDFIAGMTDRYILGLYEKLFLPFSWPVP